MESPKGVYCYSSRFYTATMKKSLVTLVVISPLWLISYHTSAGELILKTELWDFICEVEVALGPDTPLVIERVLEFPGVKNDGEYIALAMYSCHFA